MMRFAALLLLLPIAACSSGGSDDSPSAVSSATESPSPSASDSLPDCAAVWVEGNQIPADYEGCMADGAIQAAVSVDCGGKALVSYNDEWWALVPGPAHKGDVNSPDYPDC